LARADQWLVAPSRDTSHAELTRELVRAGLGETVTTLLAALAGSKALASHYRLIDLDTGAVRALSKLELSVITWVADSGITNAAKAADDASVFVLVLSNFGGMGAAIVTLDGGYVRHTTVLSADQRALVGEPPCDKGFAPESGIAGITCADIDECDAALDDCAKHATCTNTEGAFDCECDDDYVGDGKMCIAPEDMPDGGIADSGAPVEADGSVPVDLDMDASMMAPGFIASDNCNCDVVGARRTPSASAWMLLSALLFATALRLGSRRKR
jgi:EGF domain